MKSILGVDPKVKDSIEDSFQVGDLVGKHSCWVTVKEQGTTTASGVCECYCLVSSFVF
jgi:hypothetical protein